MFKDIDKYLTSTLKVYLFLLICTFIFKIVGMNYFGLDLNNRIFVYLGNLIENNLIANNIIYIIPLLINQYVIVSITNNDRSKEIKIYNILLTPIYYVFEATKILIFKQYAFIVETIYYFIISILYKRKINKDMIKRFIFIVCFMILVQLISILTRTSNSIEYIQNPIMNLILNFDYILLLLIIHKLFFMKGDENICGYQVVQHFSLLKKINCSKWQTKLQSYSSNFRKLSREEKLTYIFYLILSILWNTFTLIMIILIALLNKTLIECIFIVTSFWISKSMFGKPFHLKSMMQCFALSNITYYILNRITTPIGISILIPISLGVGLSYITSKFVKKVKPLYKGMPEDLFNETILQVVDKDGTKYNVCYDYFIKKENAVFLGRKYGYSEAGIRKIADRINKQIRELN